MTESTASPPEFMIIGAAKAGTTALYRAIRGHPGVFLCEKEPRFFAFAGETPSFRGPNDHRLMTDVVTDAADYQRLFLGARPGQLRGEASGLYLYVDKAPRVAHQYAPQARLIAILRQPAERAYSHWLHQRLTGAESLSDFVEACAAEPERLRAGWGATWAYLSRGFYGRQLDRWLEYFPREQLLILFYEDWIASPRETLARVWRHLGLESLPNATIRRLNVTSGQPRWRWLEQIIAYDNIFRRCARRNFPLAWRDVLSRLIHSLNHYRVPPLDPEIRRELTARFYEDFGRVEELTGRDLEAWKK
jgi:hypothetical protein